MGKINLLDSTVYNRIAAGEVVENPRSIVKELLENSIDAGATSITVEIEEGGISYISVLDDGNGIDPEDMPLAFMPHATSKIHSLKELDAISTLGFRGEALPSIASVADVEMISRTPNRPLGQRIALVEGAVTDNEECGAPLGTKITVRNLFARIPARAKFMRKPSMEESDVTELVAKIILSHPHCKIQYIADGKVKYRSDGNGIESAVYCIYGKQFFDNLVPISHTMPDIQIEGLIGKPSFSKHNRTYQTLIVNGRYVIHADISYCIQQCYQPYLMKRQFPVYILYLHLPTDMVDVNVHPNKLEVRFAGEKRLKGLLYNAVQECIRALATFPTEFAADDSSAFLSISPQTTEFDCDAVASTPALETPFSVRIPPQNTFAAEKGGGIAEESIVHMRLGNFTSAIPSPAPLVAPADQTDKPMTTLFGDTPVQYVGKLFNTYLIVESAPYFYLIDQHAAHEKLLYDRLVRRSEDGELAVQELLVPYIFDVTPHEKPLLDAQLPAINSCGFKIDPLSGNTYTLYALPVCCAALHMKEFVAALLTDIESRKTETDFIKEKLMQAACKCAVKGEDDLAEEEIASLLEQMRQTNTARFCPHGRPIVIRFTKSDLEKVFKRI